MGTYKVRYLLNFRLNYVVLIRYFYRAEFTKSAAYELIPWSLYIIFNIRPISLTHETPLAGKLLKNVVLFIFLHVLKIIRFFVKKLLTKKM